MKTYELFVHWKQGDDLGQHLENEDTNAGALRAWAASFRRYQLRAEQIAKAIEGEDIEISADTHMILLLPNSEKAEKVLQLLADAKMISVSDMFDEEEDEDEESGSADA